MRQHVSASSKDLVEAACRELLLGRGVVVFDDEDRENEGDLIFAAEHMTAESMAFVIRHTSGLVCVGMAGSRLDQLGLPAMVEAASDPRGTAFTVSVDLANPASTGISALDRAATARALADSRFGGDLFTRPGHVFPLRARPGGVLQRAGHTEAAVDLCRLADLQPAGVLAEITNDDGTMARMPDLVRFAGDHGLVLLSVADVVRVRMSTQHGEFHAVTNRSGSRLDLDLGANCAPERRAS
ncbi:3,4-dihydroxy-2-butanone-4-phosphate synthase [Nocardioidaceae bacterium Broad-1]|nr:3,4-dihydroxy-2-butanone-4-phosphate synthase [Nocardioidaceae bacterium Broad-1]